MEKYHKIQTVFKRDPATKHKTLLEGQYSMPEFAYLADNSWMFTEKVDGTNVRVMWTGEEVKFAGKSDNATLHPLLIASLERAFSGQADVFHEIFGGYDTEPLGAMSEVCLYGEGYGPKIQSGGKYRPDQGFVLFDVRIGRWWLRREDVENVAQKLGADLVPIVGRGSLSRMVEMARTGFGSAWGDFPAEGIVARPSTELCCRNGERVITKIKHKDFRTIPTGKAGDEEAEKESTINEGC